MGCLRSRGGSCPRTRPSTVSRGCSPTLGWTLSREPSTTCPSPLPFTESPTCNLPSGPHLRTTKNRQSSIVWLTVVGPHHRPTLALKAWTSHYVEGSPLPGIIGIFQLDVFKKVKSLQICETTTFSKISSLNTTYSALFRLYMPACG